MTHHDKKIQGGPNPSASSGDQLDQSQDSEDRKESGYNLRSMFKDVRAPLDTSDGITPNVGKRKKSVTIFGLRRGSDPAGSKVAEGPRKECGGAMFAVQKQHAVLEELSQRENTEDSPECSPKQKKPLSPDKKACSETANCPPESKNQFPISTLATEDGFNQSSSPVPCMNPSNKSSLKTTAASVPRSLHIPSPISSVQALSTEKHGDNLNLVFPNKDTDDSGPLQTSTPSVPIQGTISGCTAAISTNPSKYYPSRVFTVIQTPPDLSSSTDMESSNSLALISLGSSPPSTSRIMAVSSLSLSNTPTIMPKPETSSANTPSDVARDFSTVHAQGPSFSSSKELEEVGLPKSQEETELNRTGILKTPKYFPVVGDFEATAEAIVKSCADREFSVVTAVLEESSTSTKDQSFDTSEQGIETKELPKASDMGQAEIQYGEASETQDRSKVSHKKADSVERKDIA